MSPKPISKPVLVFQGLFKSLETLYLGYGLISMTLFYLKNMIMNMMMMMMNMIMNMMMMMMNMIMVNGLISRRWINLKLMVKSSGDGLISSIWINLV